jgi:uncharacterized Tic20 family protein
MWLHLSLFLIVFAVPILPALILWGMRRPESALVDDHGRECMNIQISNIIIGLIGFALTFCGVGVFIMIFVVGLAIWSAIAGAFAASQGKLYRAPMTLRLVTPARIPAGVIVRPAGVS